MQQFNYHTHTYRCGHADYDMMDEDYVQEFIDQGFKKIAFTDHCPEKEKIDKRSNMRMEYSQIDEYLASIQRLKEKYHDKIEIETGFEIEYLPGHEENLFELKKMADKLILGQHFIYKDNNQGLRCFRMDEFSDEDLLKYADYIKTAIQLGLPDIIAHPDLYMLSREKFGITERKVAEMICETAEKYQIPLEINLEQPYMYSVHMIDKISYPCKEFWEVASNYNVKVIYGIDAHFRGQINCYEKSIDMSKKIIGEDIIDKLKFCKEI